VKAQNKMLLERGSEGCKQARSRSSNSRNDRKGCIPPMMIPAFVMMLRSKDQTVAAGSNQHSPLTQTEAGGV
jgi:hypothetical protein